jgi:HD-GYP domain-containing protein (c-di-GMP phosphodiesterase class II)
MSRARRVGRGDGRRVSGHHHIESRIVAICDAFIAMTSPRPFRATKTEEEPLREIARRAGTQFDSALAREFQMMMNTSEKRVA